MKRILHTLGRILKMNNIGSPYAGITTEKWINVTRQLVDQHPLKTEEILDIALTSWNAVWSTQIGTGAAKLALKDVNPPATVIGYFFEKLFAKELATRYPKVWRGEGGGAEKDLHCISNVAFSTEIKASGQLGLKIYGNRSYGQQVENTALAKKDKSGYYITVNFFGDQLNLIRFGWIDSSDWKPQKSATGQMAGLEDEVYRYKLIPIRGEYTLQAPIALLQGVGGKTAQACAEFGMITISDVLRYKGAMPERLAKVRIAAEDYRKTYG